MHHLYNHLHRCIITGSQKESVAVEPEAVLEVPQEEPAQEVQVKEDVIEELQECPDHRPSSFERGKPQSILSLLLYKSNQLYMSFIYCCIRL
jgi:transcriptional accessory protein Tex/SPT6